MQLKLNDIRVTNKDGNRVYRGVIRAYIPDTKDIRIKIDTLVQTEGDPQPLGRNHVFVRLSGVSTAPTEAYRWAQALAAVWGSAEQDAGGAKVDLNKWIGKTVYVQRAVVEHVSVAAFLVEGWDFVPQADFDVKTKTTLANAKAKVARMFSALFGAGAGKE